MRRLTAEEVADKLIEMYKNNRKRFMIEIEDLKGLANRRQLRDAFLWQIDAELRENGYCLIDLREFNNSVAIIKASTIINNWETLKE